METRIRGIDGKSPQIGSPAYIDPLATLIGDLELRDHVSIWPNAVLRGDSGSISVGAWTNIQDNCVVHAGSGFTVHVGEFCVVGHGAIIHGSTIGDNCLVGMGSILMNGSTVGDNCIIGAGTLITEGKTFAEGSLIIGRPGKVVRQLSDDEVKDIRKGAQIYWDKAQRYLQSSEFTVD